MGIVVIQPWILVSKLKKQRHSSTLYWLPKRHKNPIKQDLLLILVLVRQMLTSCLMAVKIPCY